MSKIEVDGEAFKNNLFSIIKLLLWTYMNSINNLCNKLVNNIFRKNVKKDKKSVKFALQAFTFKLCSWLLWLISPHISYMTFYVILTHIIYAHKFVILIKKNSAVYIWSLLCRSFLIFHTFSVCFVGVIAFVKYLKNTWANRSKYTQYTLTLAKSSRYAQLFFL